MSRGLLRDYEPSDAIRMELFEALLDTVSPADLEVLPLWAASGVGRPRPRLYKGWAAWNTISLQLDADRVRRLVTHGRQHVSL